MPDLCSSHVRYNNVIRNNTLLKGGMYWALYIESTHDPVGGAVWKSKGKIYVSAPKHGVACDPTKGIARDDVDNWKGTEDEKAESCIMWGYSTDPERTFEIECAITHFSASSSDSQNAAHKLIKFRVDTYTASELDRVADGSCSRDQGKLSGKVKSEDNTEQASTYFWYETEGADRFWATVDAAPPCVNKSRFDCINAIKKIVIDGRGPTDGGIGNFYFEPPYSSMLPCEILRKLTGGSKGGCSPAAGSKCWPKYIEFDYTCSGEKGDNCNKSKDCEVHGCTPCGHDRESVMKPSKGDMIRVDKNEAGGCDSGHSSEGLFRECYEITNIQYNPPDSAEDCKCADNTKEGGAGKGIGKSPHECILSTDKRVRVLAPGETVETAVGHPCFGADSKYYLSQKLADTLASFGWGENIGGFVITGFEGGFETRGEDGGGEGGGYAETLTVNRMRAHGHMTKHAFSLPGNSNTTTHTGGSSWLTDSAYYIDKPSFRYMVQTVKSQSVALIDRYRQTIEMSARVWDDVWQQGDLPGEPGENIYTIVDAWPPEYLEMFVRRTYTSSAAMSLGFNNGRGFEVGLNFTANEMRSEEGGTYPIEGEAKSVSCSAYISFKDLLAFTKKRFGLGSVPEGDDWVILKDYLKFDLSFGGMTQVSKKWEDVNGFLQDKGSESNTLFQTYQCNVAYGIKFTNGWALKVSGLNFSSENEGFLDGVNPSISISKHFWDDQIGFTLAQNLQGGGTLGLMYGGKDPIIGDPNGTHAFVSAGIQVSHNAFSAPRFSPSLSFKGTFGNVKSSEIEHILHGFEFDINAFNNTATLSRRINLLDYTSSDGATTMGAGFTMQANVNNINASIFSIKGDWFFETTVKDFGGLWGKLKFRAEGTFGLDLGMPGGGGMESGGSEAGMSIGFYLKLEDNYWFEWLGFGFNINPGIGFGIGAKFIFKSKSTFAEYDPDAVMRSASQFVMDMGPVQWNLSKANGLRAHMRQQHNSWVRDIPVLKQLGIGDALAHFPILTRLGSEEPLIQYIVRACLGRAWAAIGISMAAYHSQLDKIIKDCKKQYEIIDANLNSSENDCEAKARHRTTYYPEFSKSYVYFGSEYDPEGKIDGSKRKYESAWNKRSYKGWGGAKCHPAGWEDSSRKEGTFNFNRKNCWATKTDACPECGKPENGGTGGISGCGSWSPKEHFAANCAREWVTVNIPCKWIKRTWNSMITRQDYAPYDFSAFPELEGADGIIKLIMHSVEDWVWNRTFVQCKFIDWNDEKHLHSLAQQLVSMVYYGSLEQGKEGIDEHDRPDAAGESPWMTRASQEGTWLLGGHDASMLTDLIGGWNPVTYPQKFLMKIGIQLEDGKFMAPQGCWSGLCDLPNYGGEGVGGTRHTRCERAFVLWKYYELVYKDHITYWFNLANHCHVTARICDPANSGVKYNRPDWGVVGHFANAGLPFTPLWEGVAGKKDGTLGLHNSAGQWATCSDRYPHLGDNVASYHSENGLIGFINTCGQDYYWWLFWEVMNNSYTKKAIAAAQSILEQVDACEFASDDGYCADDSAGYVYPQLLDGGQDDVCTKCITDARALAKTRGKTNANGGGCWAMVPSATSSVPGVAQGELDAGEVEYDYCPFDKYYALYRWHADQYEDEREAAGGEEQGYGGMKAKDFFKTLCGKGPDSYVKNKEWEGNKWTLGIIPWRKGRRVLDLDGEQATDWGAWQTQVYQAHNVYTVVGDDVKLYSDTITDWAMASEPLLPVFMESTAEDFFKGGTLAVGKDGYKHMSGWGCSPTKTLDWKDGLKPFSGGGDLAGRMTEINEGIMKLLSSTSSIGHTALADDTPAGNIIMQIVKDICVVKKMITEHLKGPSGDFPCKASVLRAKADIVILEELARCAAAQALLGLKIQVDVTLIIRESRDSLELENVDQKELFALEGSSACKQHNMGGSQILKYLNDAGEVALPTSGEDRAPVAHSPQGFEKIQRYIWKPGTGTGSMSINEGTGAERKWRGGPSQIGWMLYVFRLQDGYPIKLRKAILDSVTFALAYYCGGIDLNWLFSGAGFQGGYCLNERYDARADLGFWPPNDGGFPGTEKQNQKHRIVIVGAPDDMFKITVSYTDPDTDPSVEANNHSFTAGPFNVRDVNVTPDARSQMASMANRLAAVVNGLGDHLGNKLLIATGMQGVTVPDVDDTLHPGYGIFHLTVTEESLVRNVTIEVEVNDGGNNPGSGPHAIVTETRKSAPGDNLTNPLDQAGVKKLLNITEPSFDLFFGKLNMDRIANLGACGMLSCASGDTSGQHRGGSGVPKGYEKPGGDAYGAIQMGSLPGTQVAGVLATSSLGETMVSAAGSEAFTQGEIEGNQASESAGTKAGDPSSGTAMLGGMGAEESGESASYPA